MRILFTLLFFLSIGFAQKVKFGTVAPKGSAWYKVMKNFANDVKKQTGVKFKIYAGSKMGDEKAILRRMNVGQLHSAGLIGPGLGQIVPEVRIFDLPFLFENYKQVDYVLEKMFPYFQEKFSEKGFHLLAWAEAGFVNIFSSKDISSYELLKKAKVWSLSDDPVAEITFKALDLHPYSVPLTDVQQSLETGLVNTTYTPPLGAVTLQWFKYQQFMIDINLAYAAGAVIIKKSKWEKISEEKRKTIQHLAKTHFTEFNHVSRESNKKSKEAILAQGTKVLDVKDLTPFKEAGERAKREALGKLFDKKLLEKVEKLIKEVK
jgi:TRAP-type C4-dicarboxylate transport system substrate-binding protein